MGKGRETIQMRFMKVKVLEKPRRNSGYLEGKLNDFIAMNTPYVQIIFEDGEYCNPGSCASSYNKAIKRYEKTDSLECKCINKKVFLINKKLVKETEMK